MLVGVVAILVAVVALGAGTSRPAPADPSLPAQEQDAPTAEADATSPSSGGYWDAVTRYAPTNFHYDTLDAIVADSHLIVRGRLVGISEGKIKPFDQSLDDLPVVFAVVQVDEVLKGTPESEQTGVILVARLARADDSETDLPKDEVVLFLKNYAQMRVDLGAAPANEDDRYYYVRPNGYQAVLVNRDGDLFVPLPPADWGDSFGTFPSDLNGTSFADVTDQIKSSVLKLSQE